MTFALHNEEEEEETFLLTPLFTTLISAEVRDVCQNFEHKAEVPGGDENLLSRTAEIERKHPFLSARAHDFSP